MHHRTPFRAVCAMILLLLPAMLSGCAGSQDPYSKRYTALDINPNPAILNSAIVKGTDLSNLRLENVLVKDATFYNTTASNVHFKNVVFDNCRFINAKFNRAVLENVVFKGGLLTCENEPYNLERRTLFTNSRFTNLILEGVYLENAVFKGNDSSIALINCLQILAAQPVIEGVNMRIALEGCYFRRMTIAEVFGNSTLTATRCRFDYANFGRSIFSKTTFTGNVVRGEAPYQERKTAPRRLGR